MPQSSWTFCQHRTQLQHVLAEIDTDAGLAGGFLSQRTTGLVKQGAGAVQPLHSPKILVMAFHRMCDIQNLGT